MKLLRRMRFENFGWSRSILALGWFIKSGLALDWENVFFWILSVGWRGCLQGLNSSFLALGSYSKLEKESEESKCAFSLILFLEEWVLMNPIYFLNLLSNIQFILSHVYIFYFDSMKLENSLPFAPLTLNKTLRGPPVTIYPREIFFEDILSNSCYEIQLYVRNQSSEIQKIRLISPNTKHFKIKTEEGLTKKLAQGLALKISVFFCCEKLGGQTTFEDKLVICGDSFREEVALKAFAPREVLIIPSVCNVGRLLVNHDNVRQISVNNTGKKSCTLQMECDHNAITVITREVKIEPEKCGIFQFKLKSKKPVAIMDKLKFSNGFESDLTGSFVEQGVEIFGEEGEKLMMLDVGQIFIGERVEEKLFLLNNSDKVVHGIFKIFNRNVQISEIKVDEQRENFIVRSMPEEYAKQLKKGFSSIKIEKAVVQPFSEFQNTLVIHKVPTIGQLKKFHCYAMGLLDDEITQEPIIQTLIINTFNCKHSFKVPVKFISVYPRLKISSTVIEFGDVKERVDTVGELSFHNEGERDIFMNVETSENVRIEGPNVILGHRSQPIKVILRAIKAGKINQFIKFNIFDGLILEVKVFANCRSSSIRSKKMCNLSSTRDLKKEFKLYETLSSCRYERENSLNPMNSTINLNRTDALADIRTARKKKRMQEHIQSDSQPSLFQPKFAMKSQISEFKVLLPKRDLLSRSNQLERCPKLQVKDIMKYSRPLKIEELQKIKLRDSEISFGTIFIDSEVTKQIKIYNDNIDPILFEWDIGKNQSLRGTSMEIVKIEGKSEKEFTVKFKPNMLGAMSLPLNYAINRHHVFQIYITAYITLVNLDISTKNVELSFAPYDASFEKSHEIELKNKGNFEIKCYLKFQDGRHFYVSKGSLELGPVSSEKVTITYKPKESEQTVQQRIDMDKFIVKVVGGAQNIIKCVGTCNDSKIHIKQSQITCLNHLISVPFNGKINIKSCTKTQSLYKIEIPNELSSIISFDKQSNILCGEQKKEINFTILSHHAKKICSHITFILRGGRPIKMPVQCSFVMPEIEVSSDVIDFGKIPIMSNNYQETITVTNYYKNEIKLEVCKKHENYFVEVRALPKARIGEEITFVEHHAVTETKLKKKSTIFREEIKQKRVKQTQQMIKLLPNEETQLEVKFIPKTIQSFDIQLPLKLHGAVDNQVFPLPIRLKCTSVEPVVYLHPQKVVFETRIIGQGKNNFIKYFEIRNPHNEDIQWRIENRDPSKDAIFSMSQGSGIVKAHESAQLEVAFKPQNQGIFSQKFDVILKEKKVSHISLQLQGQAIFPSLKFNCNQILMPVVPIKIQTRAYMTLQNHGYDAITISKWKTLNNFAMVDITVNFVEGRLLSLAKKSLKVEIVCTSQFPISFTTMLQFYDQFGTKYELPLSCTFDNSLMTTYSFLQTESTNIFFDKKENLVKMLPCQFVASDSQHISQRDRAGCEFIKNWLNYELNIGVKKFPKCFIDSEGELFYRMVTRMSNSELVRRFEGLNSQNFYSNIYSYYSESIRILKMEGAFLNQIRPEFLLSYKDYKAYLTSKSMIVQSQNSFEFLSIQAWTALFYQLCKLYIIAQASQKMIAKFAPPQTQPLLSTVYTSQELLIFRFLNSFMVDEPAFSLCDKVRVFETIQRSLEKVLNIKLTTSLLSMKISVLVMTPEVFINVISKFLYQTLKEYGLNMYLVESDLEILGPKELILFMISYVGMLYHYANMSQVCFEASIGDKVTKIIEIQNPVNRKAKYRVKLQGSEQFCLQQDEVSLGAKSKGEIRVNYQCKQNKEEEAKLFLIPVKQDINSATVQPLSFKLKTSIVSKITLKKIQISACIYEVTNVTLEAELPIDITELAQFSVTIMDADQTYPSFFCFQQLNRTLKNNHDRLDIKLVPLTMGYKFCRVCYKSPLFGEFNFQIMAKIDPPSACKEIRLKQLKVNKEEVVQIFLPKENQELMNAQKYLNDHHCKVPELQQTKRTISFNKYNFSIVESSYIEIIQDISELMKSQLQGKQSIQLDLRCLFGKPFVQYACTLMVKNEAARDIRLYKLITSVAMKPKIVEIELRAKARESASVKIPIKNAPCEVTLQNTVEYFSIANYSPYFRQNLELICTFSPQWMMHRQITLITENRQTLEQVIYQITLIGDEPSYFDHIKVSGSAVFKKKVKIMLNLNVQQEMRIECNSKRIVLEDDAKFTPFKKSINATILPGFEEEVSSIQLFKQNSSQYYWASVSVINQKVEFFRSISLEEIPNGHKTYLLEDMKLNTDHQISCTETQFFKCNVVKQYGVNLLSFEFIPSKEMEVTNKIFLTNNQKQYQIEVKCKAFALPIISLPEIVSQNMAVKTSTINVVNNSDLKGVYSAKIEPKGIINLEHTEFQIKEKQKKELKIIFTPEHLQTKYKAIIRFESQTLPTYQYQFSAISEFKQTQKTIECEYYSDKNSFRDILFTNWFANTEKFTIETKFKGTPFEVVEPTENTFSLESGVTKRLLIKISESCKKQNINGMLTIKLNEKSWVYTLIPLEIKNLSKKINWTCVAREVYYQNLELPAQIKVRSIEASPEIEPYLTFTSEEGTNNIKLKYLPLKPLSKDQFQILLLTQKSKYVINCTVCVQLAPFDDTIYIKTKEMNEVGCVSFKLTNTKKMNVPFKAFFLKGLPDLMVDIQKNYLESYGRIGTTIFVKFASNVFNKRVEDELWVQTTEMLWRFRVVGLLSKKYS